MVVSNDLSIATHIFKTLESTQKTYTIILEFSSKFYWNYYIYKRCLKAKQVIQ